MYQDSLAGGLEPTVMQLMSYFRLALRGACSLLSIVTLSGLTETGKDARDHKSARECRAVEGVDDSTLIKKHKQELRQLRNCGA